MASPAELAAIGLGSNLGDRLTHLEEALARLESEPDIQLRQRSRWWATAAVGGPPQGDYLNGAAVLETELPPQELLRVLRKIEDQGGRVRRERNGPRTIDLDLLLYGERILREPDCLVPHPRLQERGFVLQPLVEVAAHWRHPELDCSVAELLTRWTRRGAPGAPPFRPPQFLATPRETHP